MEKQTIKAVIFDLDGTLLDTLTDLGNSVNQALAQNELPTRTMNEIRQFVGNGIATLVARAIGSQTHPAYDAVLRDTRAIYAVRCKEHTAPYDGILPMLSTLKEKGYLMAVVSNKPDSQVKRLCEQFFAGYMKAAIGQQEGKRLKPAPDSVLQAIEILGCEKEACIYVGDSDVDIETAANAGIPCLSVLWGFRDIDILQAAGATQFVHYPSEISACL